MDKRNPVICECGQEMIFMKNKPLEVIDGIFTFGWFRCPTRKGEKGCGKIMYVKIPSEAMVMGLIRP